MIISLVSQKGGSGKTTICINLATIAFVNKMRVVIIDLDPQSSSSSWSNMRDDEPEVGACHPPLLEKTINDLKKKGYSLILIDTPPHNSTAAANAFQSSDLVIIPIRPSSLDLLATNATIDLIRANKTPACVIINAIPGRTTVAKGAEDFIKENDIEILGTIGHRMSIQHAITESKGVIETEPNSEASKEFMSIWKKIMRKAKNVKKTNEARS